MEANEIPKEELVTNKTVSDSVLEFKDGNRPPLIRIEDGKVNITTLKLSMSRKHRVVMFIDLWTIAWVSAMTIYIAQLPSVAGWRWLVSLVGLLVTTVSIGKTISDFSNWLFTMNKMQAQMGEWYLDDVVEMCQDLISAGARVAAGEASKRVSDEEGMESGDAVPETIAE